MDKNTCVLYTDGSYRQFGVIAVGKELPKTQGVWGSGIHGYIYPTNTKETKTSDTPTGFSITNLGYIHNQKIKEYSNVMLVKPTNYVDGVITTQDFTTIAAAELKAVTYSLRWILDTPDLNIDNVKLHIDNEYVVLTISVLFCNDNTQVNFTANLDIIEELKELAKLYKEKDIVVTVDKVKAHTGEIGNELADQLAKLARYRNAFGIPTTIMHLSSSSKYWNAGDTRHPLLKFNSLFFTHNLRQNNKDVFSIMEYKSNVEVGEKTHEAIFGIVILKETPKIVNDVMDFFQYTLPMSSRSILASIDLKSLYSTRNLLYSNMVKDNKIFRLSNKYFNVLDPMDNPIAKPVTPVGIGNKALSLTLSLHSILNTYLNKKECKHTTYLDITNTFYNVEVNKKNVTKYSLKFKQDTKSIPVDYDKDKTIYLTIGIDVLSYSQLKAIEQYSPKITLVLQSLSSILEYYTIVELNTGDVGIFCNLYSNKKLK